MTDANWYCEKAGQRLGPFTLEQLRQMAAAGVIAPGDRVAREGNPDWAAAGTVPELFPPPPPPGPGGPALVACEKCQAKISDVAELCPQCGHPQPPLVAKERNQPLHPCPNCKTHNWVRDYYAVLSGECRGCGRPLADAYPWIRYEVQVDEVYRAFRRLRNNWYGAILIGGAALMGLIVGGLAWLVFPAWVAFLALAAGAWAGWALALPAFSYAYQRWFVRNRPLPPPFSDLRISVDDWWAAERREERIFANIRPANPGAAGQSGCVAWVIGAVVVAGVLAAWLYVDQARTQKSNLDQEAKVGAAMAAAVSMTKDEGTFSHDVILINDSPAAYGTCDLTLTVYLTTGKQTPVRQYWSSWGPKERKKVNIPAGGSIQRVDLTGTMVNTATGERGRFDTMFEWKPKAAPPKPGK